MFMKDDKKQKMASMIVSSIKKPEEKAPESQEQSSSIDASEPESDQYDVAADEVFEAIANKDKAALKESLKSMIQMCMNEDDEEPSESND